MKIYNHVHFYSNKIVNEPRQIFHNIFIFILFLSYMTISSYNVTFWCETQKKKQVSKCWLIFLCTSTWPQHQLCSSTHVLGNSFHLLLLTPSKKYMLQAEGVFHILNVNFLGYECWSRVNSRVLNLLNPMRFILGSNLIDAIHLSIL